MFEKEVDDEQDLWFVEKNLQTEQRSVLCSVNYGVCGGQILAWIKAQGSLFFLLLFPVWTSAIEALRHQASFM